MSVAHPLTPKNKDDVRRMDPNNGRCLVENCDHERAVEYAHVVPRRLGGSEMLSRVEWYWNLELGSLDLNTERNVFPAGVAIHRLFDQFCWILVPEKDVFDCYHNRLTPTQQGPMAYTEERCNFPNVPNPSDNKFRYNLVPIVEKMQRFGITRQSPYTPTPQPGAFVTHYYPFDAASLGRPCASKVCLARGWLLHSSTAPKPDCG